MKRMSDKEKIEKWLKEHDGEDYCQYCFYESDCHREVSGGPNGPIEPPCASREMDDLLDTDALLEDLEGSEETE